MEIDDRLLADGGIVNNLPIDIVRQMCADVVIAVNIGTPALTREEITSALSIVGQLTFFLGKETVDEQLASLTDRDVLIAPDLGDIAVSSFERQLEAIQIGEGAAETMAESLKRYSISPAEYAALRKDQIAQHQGLGKVDEIRFEGIERTNAEVLAALIGSKPGAELTEAQVSADLRRIYGRGDFEAVDYRAAATTRSTCSSGHRDASGAGWLSPPDRRRPDQRGQWRHAGRRPQAGGSRRHFRNEVAKFGGRLLAQGQLGRPECG